MRCNCFSRYFSLCIDGLVAAHMNLPFAYNHHDEVRGNILEMMDMLNVTFHCVDDCMSKTPGPEE